MTTADPVVYCLVDTSERCSYVGFTTNFARRLRQHRGEIKGGAAYTTQLAGVHGDAWRPLFVVHGLETQQRARQLESALRRAGAAARKTRPSPFGQGKAAWRTRALHLCLTRPRFSERAAPTAELVALRVVWFQEAARARAQTTSDWPPNVTHELGQ